MKWDNYPIVYEINTWAWLFDLSRKADNQITLGNVPDSELERWANFGFNAIWLMGVWERSSGSRKIASEDPGLIREYDLILPDHKLTDVIGSPYAIKSYTVDPMLGGNDDLIKFRQQLKAYGLLLILDFVSNHFALDHAWLNDHPERLVTGDPGKLKDNPHNYYRVGEQIFAHGRARYSSGWTDTVQLDYRKHETRKAMVEELMSVAEFCDGVRCDMAMMVINEVFLGIWGGAFESPDSEFWPMAIAKVKSRYPDFLMVAEAYWGLDGKLQEQGFNYTYDKYLYELLVHDDTTQIYSHLRSTLEFQSRTVRFTENHDEHRAAWMFDNRQRNKATTTLALGLPGMRLVQEGQMEGYRYKIMVQLRRWHHENDDSDIEKFFKRLLASLHDPVFRSGSWHLLSPQSAWEGNASHQNIIAYQWVMDEEYRLITVNLSPGNAQCFLPLNMPWLAGSNWCLQDLLNDIRYQRNGNELFGRGLFLDLPNYGYHLFKLERQ